MKTKVLWLSLLVLAVACSVAVAQEEVVLRYKFSPGQADVNIITGSGTIPMVINIGGEGAGMAMNMNMDMSITMAQVVQEVNEDGSAKVQMTMPEMLIRTGMQAGDQPIDSIVKWEKGALTTTVNGQPQPQDDNMAKLAAMLGTPMKMTAKPNGESVPDEETAALMATMYNLSGVGGMDMSKLSALTSRLPDGPVKVGDTWKLEDEAQAGGATITGNGEYKLAGFEEYEGRQAARIEGTARLVSTGQLNGTASIGAPVQTSISYMEIGIEFITFFDHEAGVMLGAEMALTENMEMMINVPNPTGQAMSIPASIENAQFTFQISRPTEEAE